MITRLIDKLIIEGNQTIMLMGTFRLGLSDNDRANCSCCFCLFLSVLHQCDEEPSITIHYDNGILNYIMCDKGFYTYRPLQVFFFILLALIECLINDFPTSVYPWFHRV